MWKEMSRDSLCMHLLLHKLLIILLWCVQLMGPGHRGCTYANEFLISQGHTWTEMIEKHVDMDQTIEVSVLTLTS